MRTPKNSSMLCTTFSPIHSVTPTTGVCEEKTKPSNPPLSRELVIPGPRVCKHRTAGGRLYLAVLLVILVGQPRGSVGAECSASQDWKNDKKCCGPGKKTKANQPWLCRDCTVGQYSATSSTSCKNCGVGRTSNSGRTGCELCPSGQYNDQAGGTCSPCAPRSVSYADRHTSYECIAGRYKSETGGGCKDCDAGQFSPSEGALACYDCTAGKYQDNHGGAACINCLQNRFQDEDGQSECKDCPDGLSTVAEGQALCSNLDGMITCTAGEYNHNGVCKVCPSGKFADTAGLTNCLDCSIGTYLSDTGGGGCKPT